MRKGLRGDPVQSERKERGNVEIEAIITAEHLMVTKELEVKMTPSK